MSSRAIYEIQADLCHTMSNAVRLEIVHLLREGPKRVSEIVQLTEYPQGTISRHLSVLRNGGVLTANRHGKDMIYQIANPKIVSICDLMREVLSEEISHRSKLIEDL
jgi:ArsR family transcriptional regulator